MIGVALEGGGAKGSYQVGAMIALLKNGIKPSMVAGTSIGSVNAALVVQGDIDTMVNVWLNSTTDLFGIDSNLVSKYKDHKLKYLDLKKSISDIKVILNNKGIDTTKILNTLNEHIDEDKIRKSKIKYGLVTVKLKGLSPLELSIDEIPKGKLSEYILASCYLPIFSFKKIIDDNYYLDGGFYNNLPITLLEKNGCNKIYTIKVRGIGLSQKKAKNETEIIEIKPKNSLGSMIIFDRDSNIRNMKMGYYDALKVVKNLDGNNYYFYKKSDFYYNRIIRKIDKDLLNRLKSKFNVQSNKALVIKIVEYLMKKNELDSLALYNIKKQIRYLKSHNLVTKGLLKEFIYSCKMF
ncbi:MAG: patatin-like phospholipase family protein [Bacilli bacterium]|nr:patatin-like phospholipase family protein [Bacilli bacterium]